MLMCSGRAASIGIILGGSIYYSYLKSEEAIARTRQQNGNAYERVAMTDVESAKKSGSHD